MFNAYLSTKNAPPIQKQLNFRSFFKSQIFIKNTFLLNADAKVPQ